MEIRISINRRQVEKIERRFGRLADLRWLERPIKDSAWYMIDSIDKNFKAEGRPTKWVAWSKKYRKKVREQAAGGGNIGTILYLTGKIKSNIKNVKGNAIGSRKGKGRVFAGILRRSLSRPKNITKRGFQIGTNVVYAATHQFGDPSRNIPARPYLMFQKQDTALIRMMFEKHVAIILET